jgi:hypothetical protein
LLKLRLGDCDQIDGEKDGDDDDVKGCEDPVSVSAADTDLYPDNASSTTTSAYGFGVGDCYNHSSGFEENVNTLDTNSRQNMHHVCDLFNTTATATSSETTTNSDIQSKISCSQREG